MRARLRQLDAGQGGFTLLELTAAMLVGLVVLMAAFMLIDHATSASKAIADRQDAAQRGRMAMERMTTAIRSQVCLGDNVEPITAGNENGLTFYANLSANPDAAQKRTIAYDPSTKTVTEQIFEGVGANPDVSFPVSPTRTDTVLTGAWRMVEDKVSQPVFRYYTYKTGGAPGELLQLGVPLTADDASRVVMVKVALFTKPDTKAPEDRDGTSLQSDIYVRLADPARPAEGPRCI